MRITFVTGNLERFGGVKIKVVLANGLVRRGHHVNLVVPKDKYEQRKYDELLPEIYHSLEEAPPADFVVGSHYLTIWKITDFGASKGRPIHLVQNDEPLADRDHPLALKAFTHPLFKRIIISDYQYGFAQKYNQVIIGRIHIGIDTALFHPGAQEGGRDARICFIHRDAPYKGVADVVAALRLVFAARPDIVVVGFGFPQEPPVALPGLAARLMKKGLRVHYEHEPPPERIAEIYRTSRVYACASLIEGSPAPPLEAMASGAAVVTTRAGIDYGEEGENLLFCDDHNPRQMADKILQVLGDDALFARLVQNGLRTARERTWERMVEEFEGVLLQELENMGARSPDRAKVLTTSGEVAPNPEEPGARVASPQSLPRACRGASAARILLVTRGFPPRTVGSEALSTLDLAHALSATHQVRVLWGEVDRAREAGGPASLDYDEYEGVRTVRIACAPPAHAHESLQLDNPAAVQLFLAYLRQFRPEVVHFQGLGALSAVAIRAALRFGAATLMTVRDYWPICHRGLLYTYDGSPCDGPDGGTECVVQGCLLWPRESWGASSTEIPPEPETLPLRTWSLRPAVAGAPLWYRLLSAVPQPLKDLAPVGLRRLAHATAYGFPAEAAPQRGPRPEAYPICPDAVPGISSWRLELLRETLRTVDSVIFTSDSVQQTLRSYGMEAKRALTLPDGISPARLPEARADRAERVTFAYLGDVEPGRCVHDLVLAFNSLKDEQARLLIAGPGPQHYLLRVRAAAVHPGIAFLGQVAPGQMPQFLSAIDVLVLPGGSRQPLPSALGYARRCGAAVVAVDSPDMRKAVIDGSNGLLYEAGRVEQLSGALNRLAADPTLRRTLADHAPAAPTSEETAQILREEYELVRAHGRAPLRGAQAA